MSNTYTSLHYHYTFSTRHRRPWIKPEIEERIWTYLGGIARRNKMKIAQLIKGGSSAWIHEEFPDLRGFAWQDGYGAFSVSKSAVPDVAAYIENQREHHQRRTFQDEFLELLKRHGVEYEERYLWD
jgi:putative transposase